MREILFRGKRIDTGEWVYGDLIHYRNNDYRILEQGNGDWDILEAGYKVDPATVGQFTGLCDKTGKWIFEGDVLRNQGCWDVRIEFENGVFWVRDAETVRYANKVCNVPISEFFISNFEIVGNIHDEVTL